MQNDDYAHKIKEIISFKEDDYEILVYFNFYILLIVNRLQFQREFLPIHSFQQPSFLNIFTLFIVLKDASALPKNGL